MKRNFQKITALIFSAILTAGLFGCGETPLPTDTAEETVTESAAESTSETASETAEETSEEETWTPEEEPIDLDALTEIPEICGKTFRELPREILKDAFVETALAYYYKNPYMQYDIGSLSMETRTVAARRTTGQTPEETDWDAMHYSQCTEYAYDLILEAYGFEFFGERKSQFTPTELNGLAYQSALVTCYDKTRGQGTQEGVIEEIKKVAQAGDILFSIGINSGELGHVMAFVGDVWGDGQMYLTHTWPVGGGSLNTRDTMGENFKQHFEPKGATQIQTADELIYLTKEERAEGLITGSPNAPNYALSSDCGATKIYLFRPMEWEKAQDLHLPAKTASRLQYPRMSISKTLDQSIYETAYRGKDIVITETITNHSDAPYESLKVMEVVPYGTTLVSAERASQDGRILTWTLDVPAHESVTLSYQVTCQIPAGNTLVIPAGRVACIPTREIELQVGKTELTKEQIETLTAMGETKKIPFALFQAGDQDLNFVNLFYQEVLGISLSLPETMNSYLGDLFYTKNSRDAGVKMLYPLEEGTRNEALYRMMLKDHVGGIYYAMGSYSGIPFKNHRIVDIQEEYYTPGDVFLSFGGENKISVTSAKDFWIDIYLGGGKVLRYSAGMMGVMSVGETIDLLVNQNFVTVLRPSLTK